MLTPAKKAMIAEVLGADAANTLEKDLTDAAEQARARGFSFKELLDEILTPAAATKDDAAPPPATPPSPPAGDAGAADPPPAPEPMMAALAALTTVVTEMQTKQAELLEAYKAVQERAAAEPPGLEQFGSPKIRSLFQPSSDPATIASARDKDVATARKDLSDTGGVTVAPHLVSYLSQFGLKAQPASAAAAE